MTAPKKHRFDVPHPTWGRVVGFCWDLTISLIALLVIPASAMSAAIGVERCHWSLAPVAAGLVLLAVLSVVFGVLWVFRGLTNACK